MFMQNELNVLAQEIGGKQVDAEKWFFVSLGSDVKMITSDFNMALQFWEQLPFDKESSLEELSYGIVCDNSRRDGSNLGKYRDNFAIKRFKSEQFLTAK